MSDNYIIKMGQIVRQLNNSFLNLMKVELERMGISDVSPTQSYIIHHLGTKKISIGELISRGYYLGSNSSYNVKCMVKNGYLLQEVDLNDTRCVNINLSKKGIKLYHQLKELFDNHHKTFEKDLEGKGIVYGDFCNSLTYLGFSLEKLQRQDMPF